MVRSAPQAVKAANATKKNKKGMCQMVTRGWLLGTSAGDRDKDGDADAVDGWLSEPKDQRFTDRKPWIGAPVAWSGGSGGFGHRALCVGYDDKGVPLIRSTDANGATNVATRPLSWFEQEWGLKYLGWSKTITGVPIPGLIAPPNLVKPAARPNPVKKSRGAAADRGLAELKKAKAPAGTLRAQRIAAAVKAAEAIPFLK